ncbi:MAG: hypothetical protein M3176_09255 [Chloroflexota bacterium]|nr:hypothetical protein [Chloroflexota bacterium]
MSVSKHEAVIGILGLGDDAIAEITALQEQSQIARQLLLGPAMYFNGKVSFALMPDGANEESEPSKVVDEIREAFVGILRKHSRHWAHIVLEDEAVTPPIYRPKIVEASGYGQG